jgi:YVTN family beta-propeller protein
MRILGFLLLCLAAYAQNPSLLILHKGASSLGFYTERGELVATVPVGSHPHEMVLAPDGRTLYVTDNGTMRIEEAGTGGNTVSIVDIAARRKTGEISLGKYHRPHGIDLDPETGRLAVSTELPDRLLILDPKTRTVARDYDTRGKTSHMVALGRGGRWAFVCNSTSNDVAAIDLSSGEVKSIPVAARPEGSAMSGDGKLLYAANREGAKITVIDTLRQGVTGEIAAGKGPVRIALTPDGKQLVYACMHDRSIEIADPAARKVIASVKLGGNPVSLSISPDGRRAYASAQDIDTVYVVSLAEPKVIRTIKTPAGSGPDPVMDLGKTP